MVRLTRALAVMACLAAASCRSDPAAPVPPLTPVVPTPVPVPPPPLYTLSGLVKDAFIDLGMTGVRVAIGSGPGVPAAVTDESGRYTLRNLPAGPYSVTLSRQLYRSTTQTVTVSGETTFNASMLAATQFPLTAENILGYWNVGGPYPENPCRLLLLQEGTSITGGAYRNNRDYSTKLTGTYVGRQLTVRVDVGDTILTVEASVDDGRNMRGVIKDERHGGNFPITIFK